jgi:hypothetical protein
MILRILLTSLSLMLLSASVVFAETARILTKENALREQCRFFSPVKAKLQYADTVTLISKEGDWYRASFRGSEGCIHKNAIEEKSFSLSGMSGTEKRSATNAEVALAGKGFTPQIEASYRRTHPDMNFRAVDLIERYAVPETDLLDFVSKGGLNRP